MDWRFNTIWFEKLEKDKFFQEDLKENIIDSENKNFEKSEYAIFWHLKEKIEAFDNLPSSDKLKYLELNWANIKNFNGVKKYKNLKRLELHYCVKLENAQGLNAISNTLEFLSINQSKKLELTGDLIELKKLRVLCLNACGSLDNLAFLSSFPNLISFRFVNTNVVDGNLTPLLEHPTLRTISFLNKRHYNLKEEKINAELAKKFVNDYKTVVHNGNYSTYRYDFE